MSERLTHVTQQRWRWHGGISVASRPLWRSSVMSGVRVLGRWMRGWLSRRLDPGCEMEREIVCERERGRE